MRLLVPFDESWRETVASLEVHDQQQEFIGDFSDSLKRLSERTTGHVILHEGAPAGFFILDSNFASEYDFAASDSIGLLSFFVARQFQGKGLGKRALLELGPYIRAQEIQSTRVFLTVNCRNTIAASLYRNCGFRDTGELYLGGPCGPQHIMEMLIAR